MDADEYERMHMRIDGPVRFRDRQREKLVLATMTGIPLLVSAMIVLGVEWSTIIFMGVVGAIGSAIKLASSSYRVVLTGRTLHVQCGLRTLRIPVDAIESAEVAPYRMFEAMLGRGVYAQSLDGSTRSYRARGLRETVRVAWRQGARRQTAIIATDRAAELASAILLARGSTTAVRVDLGAEEQEAALEVEAFLRGEALAKS